SLFRGLSRCKPEGMALVESSGGKIHEEKNQFRIRLRIRRGPLAGVRVAGRVSSGALTARETARLERREAGLNRSIGRMRSDGSLTPGERSRIETRQDRISRGIYHQKHDAQAR